METPLKGRKSIVFRREIVIPLFIGDMILHRFKLMSVIDG